MNFYKKGADELTLAGQPLDPYVISTRELKTREKKKRQKLQEGFFNQVSQQFAEASKRHFGDNPTRKIKTSHLKSPQSHIKRVQNTAYSQILGATDSDMNDITNGHMESVSESASNRNDSLNVENLRLGAPEKLPENPVNLKSEVLAYPSEFKEPSKLVRIVRSMRTKKDGSYFKHLKQQFQNGMVPYNTKNHGFHEPHCEKNTKM